MVNKKTELMAQFYQQCLDKGYTDMSDPKQSLKAKVIATDLKLNYGNIEVFFEKARRCHTTVLEERKEVQRQKATETARRNVNGVLLVTISAGYRIAVYRRPDGSYYSTVDNGARIEGKPKISVHRSSTLSYNYHEPKAVYTSATVGGVTTGGVHVTEGGYSTRINSSGNGYLEVEFGDIKKDIGTIIMSEHTIEKFKRDDAFKALVTKGEIRCFSSSSGYSSLMSAAQLASGNFATQMSLASRAVDASRIPYALCVEINDLLNRVMNALYPASDEALYAKATALAKENNTVQLQHAIDIFTKISDYRDAEKQIARLKKKYEEVLQEEKEQAILKKEAGRKRTIKLALILVPLFIVMTVAAVIIGNTVSQNREEAARLEAYQSAVSMMEAGEYDKAIVVFESLSGYENSDELILEATYRKGLSYVEQGWFANAIEQFTSVQNYRDAKQQIQRAKQMQKEEENQKTYDEAMEAVARGDYETACQKFRKTGEFSDSKEQLNRIAEIWYQEVVVGIDGVEDGVIWIDASDMHVIVQATGGYEKAKKIVDYFGFDPMNDDSLYRLVKMACLQGDLHEAKELLETSGILDLKPVKTLYDAVTMFAPYCGTFAYSSGNQSIMENIYDDPVNTVHAWVELSITSEQNIHGFDLWIKNNDNEYGSYRYGYFSSDRNAFLRTIYRNTSFSAELNENGQLVFKQFQKGDWDNMQSAVTYVPIG